MPAISRTLGEAIAEGSAEGLSGHRIGYVSTSSTSNAVVRGTTYNEQTDAVQRSIVSSSVNDTNGGTGIRKVKLTYYDGTGAGPFEEIITLNGTTAVNTVATNIRFLESIKSTEVGSNGSAVGTISLKTQTGGGGSTIGSIAAGDGKTFWAHHYVAVDKKMMLRGIVGGCTGIGYRMFVRAYTPLIDDTPSEQIGQNYRIAADVNSLIDTMLMPEAINGFARIDLLVRANSSTAGTAHCGFAFYEI